MTCYRLLKSYLLSTFDKLEMVSTFQATRATKIYYAIMLLRMLRTKLDGHKNR